MISTTHSDSHAEDLMNAQEKREREIANDLNRWSAELHPCPFRQGTHDERIVRLGADNYAASCKCGAMGQPGETAEEASELWNDRNPPE